MRPRLAPFFRNSSQAQKDEETIYRQIDGFESLWPELSKSYDLYPRYPDAKGRERYFTDEAFNLESWDETTAFHELMTLCEAGEVQAIYVAEGDRLFRSRSNALRGKILDIIRENQICVITKMGEISQSALTMEIISAVGAEDKRAFLRKCHDAKITRLKDEGRPPTGRTPFCFQWSKRDKEWSLVENEVILFKSAVGLSIGKVFDEMSPSVKNLVTLHPEGLTNNEVASKLADLGFSKQSFYDRMNLNALFNSRVSNELNGNAVDKMFKHDRYRGFLQVSMKDSASIGVKNKRMNQKKIFEIKVPRILSDEDWSLLQSKRRGRRRWATRNLKHDYLCKDILICAECGVPLASRPKYVTRFVQYRNEVVTYPPTLYYTCARKLKVNGFRCGASKCHPVATIDELVWASFVHTLQNKSTLKSLVGKDAEQSNLQKKESYEAMVAQHLEELEGIVKRRDRANRLLASGSIEEEDYIQQLGELKKRKQYLEGEIAKIKTEIKALSTKDKSAEIIEALAAIDFSALLDFRKRRELLCSVTDKILIEVDGNITICLKSGVVWPI